MAGEEQGGELGRERDLGDEGDVRVGEVVVG